MQIPATENIQHHEIKAPMLIDEVSNTEFYIGVSRNSSDVSKPSWKIQRIWKMGTIWKFGYPDGDQRFKFIWEDRFTYSYSQ